MTSMDIDTLLRHANVAFEASKVLKREQINIERKQEKENSKELSKCIYKFDKSIVELKYSVTEIQEIFLYRANPYKMTSIEDLSQHTTTERPDDEKRLLLDTDTIRILTKNLSEASKTLKKEQKNIERKLKKEKSKELLKCIDAFDDSLKVIRESIDRIQKELEFNTTYANKRTSGFIRSESTRVPRGKKRSSLHQCESCLDYQHTIRELQYELRNFQQEVAAKDELERKYREERNAKDDALRRLSEMASSRLRDNNPNIPDLSDHNRPTKIAKKLSELYHNKWNDAYDELGEQEQQENNDVIKKLLDILMTINEECNKIANDSYFEKVQKSIECPIEECVDMVSDDKKEENDNWLPDTMKQKIIELRKARASKTVKKVGKTIHEECNKVANVSYFEKVQMSIECPIEECVDMVSGDEKKEVENWLPDTMKQKIKELRKARATNNYNKVEKVVMKVLEKKYSDVTRIQPYISECVEICWLSAVQDPPLVLTATCKQEFDTKIYKEYTKRGKYMEFVVWPVLYLHEGGPILSKGVAQGADDIPTTKSVTQLKYENEKLVMDYEEENRAKMIPYQDTKHFQQEVAAKDELERKYREERDAKDDALMRLHEMASSRFRDNNPNTADLSDHNRPTKIAEKLSELYDNKWNDAYDELGEQEQQENNDVIKKLLDILMTINEECNKIANDSYFEKVQKSIECPIEECVDMISDDKKEENDNWLPDTMKQKIIELRKARASKTVKKVEKTIHEECNKIANVSYFEKVQMSIECPIEECVDMVSGDEKKEVENWLPDTMKQKIKELRKARATNNYNKVEKVVMKVLEKKYSDVTKKEIQSYISECVEICWLSAVQDPPLVLKSTCKQEFDTKMYKEYTQRGKYMEFVVWPVLYLHEGGPILSKGVAQGADDSPTTKSVTQGPERSETLL